MNLPLLLGIDCAAQPQNVGWALATFGPRPRVLDIGVGHRREQLEKTLAPLLPKGRPVLIALDAPLGWPEPLGRELRDHKAGMAFHEGADAMFRRHTDNVVADALRKRSLDVGADRIARAAHSALKLLDGLRRETGLKIPLGWTPGTLKRTEAIEVYPAATLTAHGLTATGYKRGEQGATRAKILAELAPLLDIPPEHHELLIAKDHPLDAVVCCLAAADYLRGRVIPLSKKKLAQRESWIWVHPIEPQGS